MGAQRGRQLQHALRILQSQSRGSRRRAGGADNKFEPGDADRGQPTHFYPFRNRYWFRVRVPADFGSKELVWTLTSHGKTERAFATLNPNYVSGPSIQQLDVAGINLWWAEDGVNKAPVVRVDGDIKRHAKVGEPLALAATVTDDGVPPAPAKPERGSRYAWHGLRVAWFIDRGAGSVVFDPPQFKVYPDPSGNSPWTPGWTAPPVPDGGRYPVTATFSTRGEYARQGDGARRRIVDDVGRQGVGRIKTASQSVLRQRVGHRLLPLAQRAAFVHRLDQNRPIASRRMGEEKRPPMSPGVSSSGTNGENRVDSE